MQRSQRIWIILAGIISICLIGFFTVQHLLDADNYRGRIETTLSDSLGRPVQLGQLDFSIFSGNLVATSPSIAEDPAFGSQPFLTAKDVRIGVEMMPLLLHHTLHITGFSIDQPKIALIRAENGTWNYSSLGNEGKRKAPEGADNPIPNLSVNRIAITGGAITVSSISAGSQRPSHVYSDLDVTVQNFSFANAFPFTVSGKLPAGGGLDISGNAGPINQHDASLTPLTAQLSLKQADLVAAGFVDASQNISGVADLDTKLVSNGQAAQADGKLHLTKLKLAKNGAPSSQPIDLQFSVNQDLQSLSGQIVNANLQFGKVAMAVNGSYQTRGDTTTAQLKVNGQNMPIDDLVTLLPSLGIQLPAGTRLQGGTLTATLDINGPVTALVISGPVRIANTQLAGFDLGQKLASIQALAGAKTGANTTIQALSTNLRYGPDGTRTDNLAAVVTGMGSASGGGSISPNGALNYQLVVKLDSSGGGIGLATQAMSLLPGAFGAAISQTTKNGIPVTIAGTTSNPTFTPDLKKMLGGSLQQKQNSNSNPLGNVLGGLLHR